MAGFVLDNSVCMAWAFEDDACYLLLAMRTGCPLATRDDRLRNAAKRAGGEVNHPTRLPRRDYHVDPHPQFCLDDGVVVYTTTVHGRIDVAVVKTTDLVQATG